MAYRNNKMRVKEEEEERRDDHDNVIQVEDLVLYIGGVGWGVDATKCKPDIFKSWEYIPCHISVIIPQDP